MYPLFAGRSGQDLVVPMRQSGDTSGFCGILRIFGGSLAAKPDILFSESSDYLPSPCGQPAEVQYRFTQAFTANKWPEQSCQSGARAVEVKIAFVATGALNFIRADRIKFLWFVTQVRLKRIV